MTDHLILEILRAALAVATLATLLAVFGSLHPGEMVRTARRARRGRSEVVALPGCPSTLSASSL